MSKNLSFRAGPKALSLIRDKGLQAEMVKVIAGAAGGPKWLVLNHIDRCIFSSWLKDRKEPLFLIGASSGAWRFAAVTQKDPVAAIKRLQHAYINQVYDKQPTQAEVSREGLKILDYYLDPAGIRDILNHPCLRLNIMAVRSKSPVTSDNRVLLGSGLAGAAIFNAVNRRLLRFFFERALFFDPRDVPPFYEMNGMPGQKIPLSEQGLKAALLASGSIPLVMSGVTEIPGAISGIYRDGGLTDYHMALPYAVKDHEIVLIPHFYEYMVPGWLDKNLPWRKATGSSLPNVLLISPSKEFVEHLPLKKIPDRNDFLHFSGRDQERIDYWNTVVSKSEQLGLDFLEAVESGKIRELVQPL